MMPLVSVIIPNYNHSAYLKSRIESVLNQTYRDFEVIILDDKSLDSSCEIINHYRGHERVSQVLINEVNSGSTFKQWEKGIAVAKGEFIWLAESDDIADLTFLEKLVPLLSNNANIGVAFCQSNKMNSQGKVTGTWLEWTEDFELNIFSDRFELAGKTFVERYLIRKNVIPNASAVLFRKSVYQNAGGVKEFLKTNNDWLLWLKMMLMSDVAFVAETLNNFRYHENSVIAKAISSDNEFYIDIYDRILRVVFQKQLITLEEEQTRNILILNKQLIAENFVEESFFRIKNKELIKASLLLLKGSTYAGLTTQHIKRLYKIVTSKL
jgi:glycosyltransferase involved in cell wall biosynthesis